MSEEKKEPQVIKDVEIIKDNGSVNITLPTKMYVRFQQLLFEVFGGDDEKEFIKKLEKVSKGDIEEDRIVYHMHTMITLISNMEVAAREQNLTEKVDYVMPIEDSNTTENQSSPQ
jgi:hypothetical protein